MSTPVACPSGKKRYASQLEANRALLRLWQKRRGERVAYRCDDCDGFHLSSRAPTTPLEFRRA